MDDLDITPFFKELGVATLRHVSHFALYMFFVALGALLAFFYISEKKEIDLAIPYKDEEDDDNG